MTTTPPTPPAGVDRSTTFLFAVAVLGNLLVWWLRSLVTYDLVAPLAASVFLVSNAFITWTYARREPIVGYVLGGAAVIVQVGFLILFAMVYGSMS
jgi:hypothetical protein